jgi:hypothetical protein
VDAPAAADAQTLEMEGIAVNRTIPFLILSLFAAGCGAEMQSPATVTPKKKKPASATTAQVAPAIAQSATVPQPPAPTPPTPPAEPVVKVETTSKTAPAIRITGIRSDKPQSTSEKALADAIQMAQVEIMRALQKLDPPVMAKPTLTKIRYEYLRKDSIREIQPTAEQKEKFAKEKLDANRLWVEIDVALSESQVQQLRASERVNDGIRGAGVLLAVILAAFGFLRVDAWSKGYLTHWLAIAAVVAVGAAALGLWAGK